MSKKELRRIDLQTIQNPDFLKDLNYKELDLLSEDIRNYILDVTSTNGGHVSSNLGTVEATISMCRNFDFLKDKIIFDVGHQCYTYKILTGRPLTNFRKKGGISGFQKMDESPYDHFEAGHSSTSISVAHGMAIARDLNKENYEIIEDQYGYLICGTIKFSQPVTALESGDGYCCTMVAEISAVNMKNGKVVYTNKFEQYAEGSNWNNVTQTCKDKISKTIADSLVFGL